MAAKRYEAFEGADENGSGAAWGVRGAAGGDVLYDAMFREDTARRLAELCEAMPDGDSEGDSEGDWERHAAQLEAEGFDLSDPSALSLSAPRSASPSAG